MGSFSLMHWAIVLVVVVLVFGTSKFKNAGKDLGGAVKGFKDAMRDGETPADPRLTARSDGVVTEVKHDEHMPR